MPQLPPSAATSSASSLPPIWQSEAYTLYPDAVVQGPYVAQAASGRELTSTYCAPAAAHPSPLISFKFSLNGEDNELPVGQHHTFLALPRPDGHLLETPVIVFGQQYLDPSPAPPDSYLPANTPLKIRLDMRPVLAALREQGSYLSSTGARRGPAVLPRVFVAGSPPPLHWNFPTLASTPELELHDPDGHGIYEITLLLNPAAAPLAVARRWQPALDVRHLPQYSSDSSLLDALHALALEEAVRAVEPDGTLRTGQEWAGVWTRDVSYSILLAQAALQPEAAKASLLRKITPQGRVVQDTGTGGAYPCSTDRMIWAAAAWEVYCTTGDEAWLQQVYPVVARSLADDAQNIYDLATGLVRGESSFLDWREQTYPTWMQPADISQSLALGTNAVHFQANVAAAAMARQLGDTTAAGQYEQQARAIAEAVNQHLWLPGQQAYGQFRYGRLFPVLSPRGESLGTALSVLFGVASPAQAGSAMAHSPLMAYGVPCIYPQLAGIPAYHNNAVWPFVQSFWGLAAAQVGNEEAFLASLAAVARSAALFLTYKENFVASTGDFSGTQVNSSNMLWSLSGALGLVHRGLFGLRYEAERLVVAPFVPEALRGRHCLTGVAYRSAVLDIELTGFGNQLVGITLDGEPLPEAAVPGTLTGRHTLRLQLANTFSAPAQPVRRVAHHVSPPTPEVHYQAGRLYWAALPGAEAYQVLCNGRLVTRTTATSFPILSSITYTEYQVLAIDATGQESFASEPLAVEAEQFRTIIGLPRSSAPSAGLSAGPTAQDWVETSHTVNPTLSLPVTVSVAGLYALDFCYANGNGPLNTALACALRTLRLGRQQLGTVVLPQRGQDAWSDWGYSSPVIVHLEAGPHTFTLSLEEANGNMHGTVNQARLRHLRLTRLT